MATGSGPQRGYPIENVSGEGIPPRSVVLVVDVIASDDKQKVWSTVTKYGGENGTVGNIMVTGPGVIPAKIKNAAGEEVNGRGTAYYDDFIFVTIDPASDPAAGDVYGPIDGEWFIGEGGAGFMAQGSKLDDSDPLRGLFYRTADGGIRAVEGRLLTEITPATNGLTGATGFTFTQWVEDKSLDPQTDPLTLMEDVDESDEVIEVPGVNRSTKLACGVDGYVILNWINKSWRPVWAEDVCPD